MSKKILLVEDETIIAMSEARMLEKHGFEVSTVYNGEKAVETAASDPDISLILMDIDLGGGMDGTETAERILATRNLPVVFLSSHTEPAVVEKTEGITSYGYIVKNSGETVLLASIRMAFRLWESEDKFRTAFEYTSVGMVLTSPSGELLQINEAFASMLGYSSAEIYSVNFTNLTHPKDVEMSIDQMKMMLDGKADHRQFTKRYIRKNGTVVWANINTMLLRDSEGKPLHFVTHSQNITESKRMQEEIDRQREQYDLLLRSAPTPILVVQDGKYVYSNPSAAELLGYSSSQELLGTSIQHTISQDSLMRIEERMEKLEAGRKNPPEEITILCRNGKTLCCESTSIPITFNSSPAALIIGRDLTVQKQVEAALEESRDKLASILKAAPTGIGVVQGRKKRTIVEANEKLCLMTGYSRDELIGKPARVLYPSQEDFDYVGSEKYRQIDTQGSGSVETRWKKKDGTIMEVLLASTPIHSTDISQGVTFTAMDITKRNRAERELREKEALYRNLMENSIDAVYLLSETGTILQVNHTACKMLGYSKQELLQLTIDDVDPNYPSKHFIEFWRDKPKGTTVLFETIHRHKCGKELPVEVNGIFFMLDGEKYLFGVSRELTERK
ncbi:MAG: PAS domain S-box protein, partial [Spirochaetia bacterium]